ncbi:extracellular serine proteinase-like [Diadema antillarum]|uniref:extracellular serine proteinase-like n=1 Tax=Diadema antillarum TaxID=105358 RepID=UPI003A84B2D1
MKGFIILLLAALATAELAPLHTHKDRIPGRYLVKLKAGKSLESTIASLGDVRIIHKYRTVFNGFAAELTNDMVTYLRSSGLVEYIEEDGIVRASSVASWGLDRVDQISLPLNDEFNPIGDGSDVDVYVIDTGINAAHQDFGGRAQIGYDALGGDGVDCNGHGTHCSGTVGGTVYGVASGTRIFGVRVLNCYGSGSTADVVEGCEWVANNHVRTSVASLSLGGGASQTTDDAIAYMVDAGITVAVAAGNDDADACNYSPARAAPAISVGATDAEDVRAYFSNYGYCVDIFAPGVSITSAWYDSDTATNTISGTSMACPHVAGAAAVLLGIEPELTPQEVREKLQLKANGNAGIGDLQTGSPDLLLYIGEGDAGGGFITDPYAPIPTNPPPAGCGGYFNESSGSFTSPNYPNNYENSLTCDYLVVTGDGKAVTVTFDDFNLESSSSCSYDSLTIYDGASSSDNLLGEWCGTNSPGIVTGYSQSMLIRFKTDSSLTYSGFSASYVTGEAGTPPETVECGHVFTEATGQFTSPNYPGNYDNNEDCSFTIQAEAGETVTLSFSVFNVESHSSCGYDAVQVSDGDKNVLQKLCGSEIPDPIMSTNNGMLVDFTTDGSITYTGFVASFVKE